MEELVLSEPIATVVYVQQTIGQQFFFIESWIFVKFILKALSILILWLL